MASSSKVKFTLLASEWGSKHGGISTFNRILAIELAKHSKVDVSVFVPRCNQEELDDALSNNIMLVQASRKATFDETDWLIFPPENLQIDIVIGHGVVLGRKAQIIRESRRCKWIQLVHTEPEDLGLYKSYPEPIAKDDQKHTNEVELCELADLVVAVGPLVADVYRRYLRSCRKDQKVLHLTPGIFNEFSSVEQVTQDGDRCRVLMFGRGDAEDFELKRFDILGKAVGKLKNANLIFVGAGNKQKDAVADKLKQCGIPPNLFKVRPIESETFLESREELKKLFCEVDLAIMPSRTEGFGLTALEALSAGLPILVGVNSGFGEALSRVPLGSGCVIHSDDPFIWAEAIERVWSKDRRIRLEESDMLRTSYAKRHDWENQCNYLVEMAKSIVTAEPSAGQRSPVQTRDSTKEERHLKISTETRADSIPTYILARGEKALVAYHRALETGKTKDSRVKVSVIGRDRVGKTSLCKSLRGEPFNKDECSTDGVQMFDPIKNAGTDAWKNPASLEPTTALDHKSAEIVTKVLRNSSTGSGESTQEAARVEAIRNETTGDETSRDKPTTEVPTKEEPRVEVLKQDVSREAKEDAQKPGPIATQGVMQENDTHDDEKEQKREKVPHHVATLIEHGLTRDTSSDDEEIWPVIWDFAGQSVYRAIHPMFMSQEAIHVLVMDLRHKLSKPAPCRFRPKDGKEMDVRSPYSEDTNLDHIMRWMDLVLSLRNAKMLSQTVPSEAEAFPCVILVGTHADEVRKEGKDPFKVMESVKDTLDKISIFETAEYVSGTFVIDNSKAGRPKGQEDPEIVSLRERILKEAKNMPHTNKEIPLQWLCVEQEIDETVRDGKHYVRKQEFKEDIAERICRFNDKDDVEELLHFLQTRGRVIYHGLTDNSKGLVVLDPQWLITVLNQIITVNPTWKNESRSISKHCKILEDKGYLSKAFLNRALEKLDLEEDVWEPLLSIMVEFNLICSSKGCIGENYPYLVPCMLTLPRKQTRSLDKCNGPLPVFLTFNTNYVPTGLFCRLVVLFWEWASQLCGFPIVPAFFSNAARFNVSPLYQLSLESYKTVIRLQIWTDPLNSNLSEEQRLCEELLRHLENCRTNLSDRCHWLRTVSWDLLLHCELCSPCPDKSHRDTDICIWHQRQDCSNPDCAHYIPLVKFGLSCEHSYTTLPPFSQQKLQPWYRALETFKSEQDASVAQRSSDIKRKCSCCTIQDPKRMKSTMEQHGNIRVKTGSPTLDDLEALSKKLGVKWQALARRLEFNPAEIEEYDEGSKKLSSKAHQMLMSWKDKKGSDATFQVLYDALCHDFVELRVVAEDVCCD